MSPNDRNITVLYVDDEALARKYFSSAVESDYTVLTSLSVAGALDVLSAMRGAVDIVVTDYRMPGQNGVELLRRVHEDYPHIVSILLTAYADKEVLLDTVNRGEVFRILEKPLQREQVRAMLREASARGRARIARIHNMNAIGETLAFLAHELNTPLAAISNFARGMRRRATGNISGAELSDASLVIQDNARYCMSMLSAFVDSLRIANAPTCGGSKPGPASASQVVATLLDTYPLTKAQRASIIVEVREDFGIAALPNCVSLVLSSILSNALRALEEHHAPVLRFTVIGLPHPQIVITDNGPGIPVEILERLLVDPVSGHGGNGGNGWGMIFCNRVMQSFGGSIAVTSEPGQSTTIALNFPALKKD
ncbi:MAG TPA: hybrid sensor histidine kinase/response regulator [Telluria sp.]|nr:hybrid sensor histidine kinase/response regulator [Telluria sp.]